MDIKELIKLVIEIVEKIKSSENQRKVGICFDEKNINKVKDKLGNSDVFYYKDFKKINYEIDTLYFDFISIKILPQVALGIDDNDIASLIKMMLLKDKKIVVLGYETIETANVAYLNLFENYYKILEQYGIEFENKVSTEQLNFAGNVLSKKDIMINKDFKYINVRKNTVITTLALEEATKENITISQI